MAELLLSEIKVLHFQSRKQDLGFFIMKKTNTLCCQKQ